MTAISEVANDTRVGIHQEVHDPVVSRGGIGDSVRLYMFFCFIRKVMA